MVWLRVLECWEWRRGFCDRDRYERRFLELMAIDLDIDSAFELAQMQRQLSRWHLHWAEIWADGRFEKIAPLMAVWVEQVRGMAGVLV
jgi:hypothetical protein